MKKKILFLYIAILISYTSLPQAVGIGTTTPHASAVVDITATNKGMLMPRMNTPAVNSILNPAKGLLVYDSAANQLMANIGTPAAPNWQSISSGSGWSLTGNSGTNPGNNFIGTTDLAPVILKTANVKSGFVDSVNTNTVIGFRSLNVVTTGAQNSAFGYNALRFNTAGTFNTASGYQALRSNINGSNNTATGGSALQSNTGGSANTATGTSALLSNITGGGNTATGTAALQSNTDGNSNTATGVFSLESNIGGSSNTATGAGAMRSNTTGGSNTANGAGALENNTIGNANTANGSSALFFNTSGVSNTATGVNALLNNTTGFRNTATGTGSLINNTTAIDNTANGSNALLNNVIGSNNTAVGSSALLGNRESFNTACGFSALSLTTNSQFNTALGYLAGNSHNNGFNNVFVGAGTGTSVADLFNVVAVGQGTICTASSQARIGNIATNSIGGFADWTVFSDGRYKKDIKKNVSGLSFIMKLRPVTYHLDVAGICTRLAKNDVQEMNASSKNAMAEKEEMVQSGFVAQEVEQAAAETGYDFSGVDKPKNSKDFYGLRYASFVAPMVKAMQEQQQMIDTLKKQNVDLQKRVSVLEKK